MPPLPDRFRALVVHAAGEGQATLQELPSSELPPGEVTVEVAWSSLNYKDGLAVTGKGKVVRRFPMVPGIDLAGTVLESSDPSIAPGQAVLATGGGLGEERLGGYARLARLRAEWTIPVPAPLTPRQAMVLGTAGLTAMLCAEALERAGVRPGTRPVLVTGAAGGVGSLAVALLSRMGHRVAASTGRPAERPYLEGLGATEIVERAALSAESGKPLEPERWAGAVDTVGGRTLANVLKGVAGGGAVAACGLVGGADLPTTVHPFILRGVSLLGVDSVRVTREARLRAWARLRDLLPPALLDGLSAEVGLSGLPAAAERILAGQVRGRVVVDVAR